MRGGNCPRSIVRVKPGLVSLGVVAECDALRMRPSNAQALPNQFPIGWSASQKAGYRALDTRAILADPRSPTVQQQLNLKVKYRDSFRPFASSVLWEDAAEWFRISAPITCFTGCGVLVNTSFNIRSEPIACTPQDALRCWIGTEAYLVLFTNLA